jgi:hypothetical protein
MWRADARRLMTYLEDCSVDDLEAQRRIHHQIMTCEPKISSRLGKKSIASSDMSCRWQR